MRKMARGKSIENNGPRCFCDRASLRRAVGALPFCVLQIKENARARAREVA